MTEIQETLLQICTELNAGGSIQRAFNSLRCLLSYPSTIQQPQEVSAVLSVFADVWARLEYIPGGIAVLLHEAAQKPEDASVLSHLGQALMEVHASDLAATVLAHAYSLYPQEQTILTDLCVALEKERHYTEVCQILRDAPESMQRSFLCTYLLAFNSLMCGDLETPRQLLSQLQRLQSQDGRDSAMAARIRNMLQRVDMLARYSPFDEGDLRGWHLVITSSVLLHLSPDDRGEGMKGRYGFVMDSYARCLEGIRKVQTILEALQIRPPRLFALSDRDSRILASAAAQSFHIPLEIWPETGSDAPGLIVAYDLGKQNGTVLSTLHQHRPGQILWSHVTCWNKEQTIAADLTTYFYWINIQPWGSSSSIDPETGREENRREDTRAPDIIGAEILSATLEPDSLNDLPNLLDLVRSASDDHQTLGLLCTSGQRQKQWVGGPAS